jgi:sterol desaturase/sphingolipid hydroxylase (fatty acid hydroxylase superfamily)
MVFTRPCGLVPVHLLGLANAGMSRGGVVAAAIVALSTWWGFFLHANLRWRFGWLEQIVATPAFHHWHHVADEPLNRNFASTLPMLDRLFGTLHLPAHRWPARYGIGASRRVDGDPLVG